MSELEKEAVEQLKKLLNDFDNEDISESDLFLINKLIEKQQKEIDELTEKNASLQKEIKLMKSININDNYISKEKIREIIKKYGYGDFAIQKIIESLEE